MTNLEAALASAKPWPNGARHALNTEARPQVIRGRQVIGLVAELENCEIRASVILDESGGRGIVELQTWQAVAHLDGWRPA